MVRNAQYYETAALAAFNQGFATKTAKQAALADLNRAFECVRNDFRKVELENAPHQYAGEEWTEAQWADRAAYFAANELPFDLHQVRERHVALILEKIGVNVAPLVELRAVIKAAEVVRLVKAEKGEVEKRVEKALHEIMALRQEQYREAIDLGELFGGMPVSANSHWVVNEYGTRFLRTFYYLRGKLTPLMVLVAAAEELARRAERKENA